MNNCLLLIDIQNDYFPKGNMVLDGMIEAADNSKLLLEAFRHSNTPIIHIQHVSIRPGSTFFLPDSSGVEINALVAPRENETVVRKNYPNSFRETSLLAILKDPGIDTVTICGAMSHMCIDATTRAAFDHGFKCVVAEDACATKDLAFKGKTIKADDVHASFMAALSAPYAHVATTQDILYSGTVLKAPER